MDILQIPIHNIILKIGQVVQDLLFEIMLWQVKPQNYVQPRLSGRTLSVTYENHVHARV